jgi:hypothetical protein
MADYRLARKLKLAKSALTLKALVQRKEKKLRRLQKTDQNDEPVDTTVQISAPVTNYTETPKDQAEQGEATAENAKVEASKPIGIPNKKDNNKAPVQFSKFHGFKKPTKKGPGPVNFNVYFYFFGIPIPKFVVLRLRINYVGGRLRSLQDAVAESARTDCKVKDPNLAGKTLSKEEGQNVNFDCEANATLGDASTASYSLNTDIPLTLVNADGKTETIGFDDVNFNGDTGDAATNIEEGSVPEIKAVITIKEAEAFFEGYFFKIIGNYSKSRRLRNLLEEGGQVEMDFKNEEDAVKKYQCTIKGITTENEKSELSCDTSSDPLYTNVGKVHLSSGSSTDGTLVSIEMNNPDANSTALVPFGGANNRYYSKSSSGLSGGAIAGIVIACVVVLAAASIAAILLRKPSPPTDITTVVDLKAENL